MTTEKCQLCNGEGIDSGGVTPWGSPTPPLPCPLCKERKKRIKAEEELNKLKLKYGSLEGLVISINRRHRVGIDKIKTIYHAKGLLIEDAIALIEHEALLEAENQKLRELLDEAISKLAFINSYEAHVMQSKLNQLTK